MGMVASQRGHIAGWRLMIEILQVMLLLLLMVVVMVMMMLLGHSIVR